MTLYAFPKLFFNHILCENILAFRPWSRSDVLLSLWLKHLSVMSLSILFSSVTVPSRHSYSHPRPCQVTHELSLYFPSHKHKSTHADTRWSFTGSYISLSSPLSLILVSSMRFGLLKSLCSNFWNCCLLFLASSYSLNFYDLVLVPTIW